MRVPEGYANVQHRNPFQGVDPLFVELAEMEVWSHHHKMAESVRERQDESAARDEGTSIPDTTLEELEDADLKPRGQRGG